MSIVSKIVKMPGQKAIYWAPGSEQTGGRDFDDYGQPMYASPVEINCRWQDKSEQYIAPGGDTLVSHSIVFLEQDVRKTGVLMLGELADVTDADNPKNNDGAFEIMRFDKVPWLRGTEFLRKAYL